MSTQPVSVTVDATNWSPYSSGVFKNCGKDITHAVLLVGVVGGNWKIKNSWGSGWGDGGYFKFRLLNKNWTKGPCNLLQYGWKIISPKLWLIIILFNS